MRFPQGNPPDYKLSHGRLPVAWLVCPKYARLEATRGNSARPRLRKTRELQNPVTGSGKLLAIVGSLHLIMASASGKLTPLWARSAVCQYRSAWRLSVGCRQRVSRSAL